MYMRRGHAYVLWLLACLWCHGEQSLSPHCTGACPVPKAPARHLIQSSFPVLRGGAGSSQLDSDKDTGAEGHVPDTDVPLRTGLLGAGQNAAAARKHREKLSRAERAPRLQRRRGDHAQSPSTLFESGVRALPQVSSFVSLRIRLSHSKYFATCCGANH